jgi:hypothetical protein
MAHGQTQNQTQIQKPNSQINIRTLSSDIKSISEGKLPPKPELITTEEIKVADNNGELGKKSGALKTIITIALVVLILWLGYFYIYPYVYSWYQKLSIPSIS